MDYFKEQSEIRKNQILRVLKTIFLILLIIGLAGVPIFFYLKILLPLPTQVVADIINNQPSQTETADQTPFKIIDKGFEYTITPKYNYEISGMVVSLHDSRSWIDLYHRNDPFNTRDLCLLWGSNITSGIYQFMKFSSGDWSCEFEYKSSADKSLSGKFSLEEGSNNHLLPATEAINQKIRQVERGDQVYIKGRLVDYSIESSGKTIGTRTTSITRTDRGNGACEVIFVDDIQILKVGNPLFRLLFRISEIDVIASLLLLILFFAVEVFQQSDNDRI